jgi:hypothetical protein
MRVNYKELPLFEITSDNLIDNANNFNEQIILLFINRHWPSSGSNEVHSTSGHCIPL